MIITLKGCTATAFIGGLNFFKVSKGTVSGADVTISTSTISKDAATSTSAREIATVALKSNYENLVVTVTMGGTTVNWYAGGKVTIPANTAVTGDIKISASATAVSGGEVVDPEEPSLPTSTVWYIDTIASPIPTNGANMSSAGFAHTLERAALFRNKPINAIRLVGVKTGDLSYGKYSINNDSFTKIGNITISTIKEISIHKIDTITLVGDENIWIGSTGDTGSIAYGAKENANGFLYKVKEGSLTGTSNTGSSISFDLGYVVD